MQESRVYSYDGPVLEFGKLIMERWSGETTAPSEKKAKSNLAFQFKNEFDKGRTAKITLPGACRVVNRRDET